MTNGTFGQDGENVFPFQAGHELHPDPALAKIEGYWTEMRSGRLVPSRSEIDPRGLEGVLGHAFILERLTTGLARIRISGSHMTELVSTQARGLPLSSIFVNDARKTLAEIVASVFDEPAMARLTLVAEGGLGRPDLLGNMVLLPLRSDLGDINRVLGGISMKGTPGRTSRRLTINGHTRQGLTGYAERPGRAARTASQDARPDDLPRATKRTQHLRLVVVNDA